MNWIVVLTSVIAAWAMLRVFGGERQRQVQDLQVQIMNNAAGQNPPSR